MRQPSKAITCATLSAALALGGCGSSGPATIPHTNISFKSPAITATAIPTRYTCDGKDISPPFEWGPVPAGTKELVILLLGIVPSLTKGRYSVAADWGLAGINPALHKIAAGQVPPGAHVGRTLEGSNHYNVCPPQGAASNYQFSLYAVPTGITVPQEFGDMQVLTGLASGNTPLASHSSGGFPAAYKRK
jgi:phosphatidylethanolamine-binding protein (PEBP) family uncharacterized protein